MRLDEVMTKTSSGRLQNEAYSLIRKARAVWQRAILDRHREYTSEKQKLRKKIEFRKKDSDGNLYSPLLLTRLQTTEWYAIKRMTATLKDLQELEAELINTISVMDSPIPSDDLDELSFTIPLEATEEAY